MMDPPEDAEKTGGKNPSQPTQTLPTKIISFVKKVFWNLTIEPPLFMATFASSLEEITSSQLLIYKSCIVDFDYNSTVCDNLLLPEYEKENLKVQDEIAQFNAYVPMFASLFPIFFAFYLGAWSDIVGRKFIIYLFILSRIIGGIVLILMSVFLETPKEWYFLSIIPTALAGGYGTYGMGIYSFISDISKPEDRAFRMSMLSLVLNTARPLGAIAGAYLLETGGYECVFSTSTTLQACAIIFLYFCLRPYKWKRESREKVRDNFSLLHIKDAVMATFKKRPGPNRKYIIVLLFCLFVVIGPYFGEYAILFLFVRTKFLWGVSQYSTYSGIVSIMGILGLSLIVPLLDWFHVKDTTALAFLTMLGLGRHISRFFATEPWILYLGDALDFAGSHVFSLIRALITCCIPSSDYGKVFSVFSAIESLAHVGFTQAYALVWRLTSSTNVSLIFLLSITIAVIPFVLSIYILVDVRGKSFEDVTSCGKESEKTDEKFPLPRSVIRYEFKISSI